MRRFLTEAKSGDVADGLRTRVVSAVYDQAQENDYEIHNRHPFAHDIDCHNRCGCAGWNRAWSSEVANHRPTADTCADDCFAGRDCVEAFPAQVTISFNDEIAPTGVGKGYAAFRSVSEAHISRGRDGSVVARDATADSDAASSPERRSLGDANPCYRGGRAVRLRHRLHRSRFGE
jgi:hypothetical protein